MSDEPEDRPTIATVIAPEDDAADPAGPPGEEASDDAPDSRGQQNVEDRPNVGTVDPSDYPEQQ